MTWIVGTNSPFGHAVLSSDICVTFTEKLTGKKSYKDCVQKVYPLGRFIVGGFSGSIRIGFELVNFLKTDLAKIADNEGWILDAVSNTWFPEEAKRIFFESEKIERNAGCSILLAASHPSKIQTDVYKFTAPNFLPIKAKPDEVLGIGTGSDIENYMTAVQRIHKCGSGYRQMGMAGEKAQARYIGEMLEDVIRRSATPGISSFFQIAVATKPNCYMFNHEYGIFTKNGIDAVSLPPVATNYEEFRKIAKALGQAAEGTAC